jgi:hypothetical protein
VRRRLPSADAVSGRFREAVWRLAGRYEPVRDLSYPVDSERLPEVRILWPSAYHWAATTSWLDPLREGLARHVPVAVQPIEQPETAVAVFVACVGSRRHEIAVDFSDYADVDEAWVERASRYFKMQFDPTLHQRAGIGPGGYLPYRSDIYGFLPALRRRSATARRPVVYGRFSPNNDVRREVLGALRAQTSFRYDDGQASSRYGPYLAGAARSSVCIDLPGRGPLCFRLVDYLAAGCCVVAIRHRAVLPVPLEDGVQLAYADSAGEVVELCTELLDDPARRDALAAGARTYFDRYLERRQLGAYYLGEILTAASA